MLVAVSRGLSNQEIADQLHMGYGTVKTHVSHLLTKLECRDRAQLVMHAYESGLTVPGRELTSTSGVSSASRPSADVAAPR